MSDDAYLGVQRCDCEGQICVRHNISDGASSKPGSMPSGSAESGTMCVRMRPDLAEQCASALLLLKST